MRHVSRPVAVLVGLVSCLAISTRAAPKNTRAQSLWDAPRQVFHRLPEGEPLSRGIKLKIFEPFVAGMTLEEAQQRHGAPERYLGGVHYEDWSYAQYRNLGAVVEVAYEPGGDTCGTHHRRTLYAYPVNHPWPMAAVIEPQLLQQLTLPSGPTRLLVTAGEESAWCLLRDGKVEIINWYRPSQR
jgi:hypothetical protein